MGKSLTRLIVAAICIIACLMVAFADDSSDVVVSLQIDNPIMKVNGVEIEIDAGKDTKPIIRESRTLVPIRAIIESFGGTVDWEQETQSVLLTMEDDIIQLFINSDKAYFNNDVKFLDVMPIIINGRTMLPIRFIAESFNLGVAWDNDTKTVSIIRNIFTENEYNYLISILPEYSGKAYIQINNNIPFFKDYEIISGSFEYYSELDELGRCNVCFASVAKDLMPTEERESISSIIPTGWVNVTYDNINGGYLYNRCHLIGFQLTGENANERNLITGTRYLNVEGMLPFENKIAEYIEKTGNRVAYRATPVFTGRNLVADGVMLEAYSIEDYGQGISFCIYCYNVQPEIKIDYATGASLIESVTTSDGKINSSSDMKDDYGDIIIIVYRTPSGKKYHFDAECGGENSFEIILSDAKTAGLTPCSKCANKAMR